MEIVFALQFCPKWTLSFLGQMSVVVKMGVLSQKGVFGQNARKGLAMPEKAAAMPGMSANRRMRSRMLLDVVSRWSRQVRPCLERSGHACKGWPCVEKVRPCLEKVRPCLDLEEQGVWGAAAPHKKRGLGGGSPPQKSGGWGAAAPHQKIYKEFQFIKWILFSPQLYSPAMPLRVRLRFARPCLKGSLGLDGRGATHCRPLGRQMRAAPRTV